MEKKKNSKVDLEKTKNTFFLFGVVIVLCMLIVAFEWSTHERAENTFASLNETVLEEELIPLTEMPEPEIETPPEIQVSDIFDIVDNEVQISNEIIFLDDRDIFAMDLTTIQHQIVLEEEVEEDEIFIIVEDEPKFRGGSVSNFSAWVQSRVRYPQMAQENGVQGRVSITFVVEPTGYVSNVEVVRGIDKLLDEEAKRVVANSPKWTPGKQREIPVRVRFTIIVNFQLQ